MIKPLKMITLFLSMSLFFHSGSLSGQSPLNFAQKVADKLMRESSATFDMAPQSTVLGMHVIDFKHLYGESATGIGYALSFICSDTDTSALLGFSSGNATSIWLNDSLIFKQEKREPACPKEISYNRFLFQDTVRCTIKKGCNKLLIKSAAFAENWGFFLRAITPAGDENTALTFSLQPFAPAITASNWLCIGPFPADRPDVIFPPELETKQYYRYQHHLFAWTLLKKNILLRLTIKDDNTYKRESYLDWHYANGAAMLALTSLSDATGDEKYVNFVKNYCDFIISNLYYFEWQYDQLHAYRGSYHRIFRRTMLDDAGAPALPFLALLERGDHPHYRRLIEAMADYISHHQMRLPDGAFCRPEPEPYTVWADDLFMSVPFLLRMGKWS
ncbi:glycoside hydrolase family 88 protein, partial [candidate division KSB1 bacterium]|nr:glycoside hydrolase family 88 protein [candidate division KSB1 bacterium]